MEDPRIYNRQFLLARSGVTQLPWERCQIGEFYLHVHPNLTLTRVESAETQLCLLGYVFDYRHPEWSNNDILNVLSGCKTFEACIQGLDACSGQFVFIYKSGEEFKLMHDACGQREVYYDRAYDAFASQPKLLAHVVPPEALTDLDSVRFYQSGEFLSSKIFVGDSTHLVNVKHLVPNHYIDVYAKSVQRFFPTVPAPVISVEAAATKAISMLKGFMKAASLRYDLQIGVTAGYDSRVLFLVSQNIPCTFYVGRNRSKDNAIDIRIAQRLATAHDKVLEIRDQFGEAGEDTQWIQDISIDFPRYRAHGPNQVKKMVINGNLSEIARNYFGVMDDLTGADLARMSGLGGQSFVEKTFEDWLTRHRASFREAGYDYRDMFYWEEKMGNWAAKGKTEAAITVEVYSPFCSRALLSTLLSTDRKYRDKQFNILYDAIIKKLSPIASRIPINPSRKLNAIRTMKKLRIYNTYRRIGIKFKLLKS